MQKPVPHWFTALFVSLMLLCSVVVVGTLFHQASTRKKIADVQINLEAVQGRLRKQQKEFDQIQAELPQVQAELEIVKPQAQAAYDQEQALRQQRKDLRAENAALADEVEVLAARMADNPDMTATMEAVTQLEIALTELQNFYAVGD